MEHAAKAAAIAHKYGLKVDTYIQWNTFAYETFFAEVPYSEKEKWYQVDVNGKPILLTYGYQQSFRYRPCFNNDNYMKYFKEKILRYAVEKIKTDFVHFDNFDLNSPLDADHNPATIKAFRKYIENKYTPQKRVERFGFSDVSHVLPPMWNESNSPQNIVRINDPVIQEWIDFRCWTMTTRLAECARFVRAINKEIVIEVNPTGLTGSNRAWETGINHPDLMQYTIVIWTEDGNDPRWDNGVVIGKFRHYKLGRTTNNYIITYNYTSQDYAENMALNRTISWLGIGAPKGVGKRYLDFWKAHKDIYTSNKGAEKVAVLRNYASMAYNTLTTHLVVNMTEQALQQNQIPFDIIFDQQLDQLSKYSVLILANQECLSDEALQKIDQYVKNGGGLVSIGSTGLYDEWRRMRKTIGLEQIFGEIKINWTVGDEYTQIKAVNHGAKAVVYGKGLAVYLPELVRPPKEAVLGYRTVWEMPSNAHELKAAITWVARESLPLTVEAPEWVGVSHDQQAQRDIIHLFNYRNDQPVVGITLRYNGHIKRAYEISPDHKEQRAVNYTEDGSYTVLRIPNLDVYEIVVLEK